MPEIFIVVKWVVGGVRCSGWGSLLSAINKQHHDVSVSLWKEYIDNVIVHVTMDQSGKVIHLLVFRVAVRYTPR